MTNPDSGHQIPSGQVRGGRCIYKNCRDSFAMSDLQPENRLPRGWNAIVAARSSLLVIESFLSGTDIDALLCPEHSALILGLLRASDSVCSRKECPLSQHDPQSAFRRGWRQVVIGNANFLEPHGLLEASHDGLICNQHFREILSHFKLIRR